MILPGAYSPLIRTCFSILCMGQVTQISLTFNKSNLHFRVAENLKQQVKRHDWYGRYGWRKNCLIACKVKSFETPAIKRKQNMAKEVYSCKIVLQKNSAAQNYQVMNNITDKRKKKSRIFLRLFLKKIISVQKLNPSFHKNY